MVSEYVRTQPDFFAVTPAADGAVLDVGAGVYCSPGMSSSYLITADGMRVVVNTGMWFEAKTHRRKYDRVTTEPTRYIILTQSHTDHIGGIDVFRDEETQRRRAAEHRVLPSGRRTDPRAPYRPIVAVFRRRHGPAGVRTR